MKYAIATIVLLTLCTAAEARGRRGQSSGGGGVSHSTPLETYAGPTLAVEKSLVERTNIERARFGLAALVLDPILQLRARRHTAWMARNGSMTHSNEGRENIGMGQGDSAAITAAWMGSSGHRANMLSPGVAKIGVCGYVNEQGQSFWTMQLE